MLKRIGTALAIVALTVITWIGLNYAKAQWADHVAQRDALSAVIQVINYNIQQGKLVVPSPDGPKK